ncbi:MAG: c-type cytochrome biogenesis protein CcmI, partial [Rubrivivax sp.]
MTLLFIAAAALLVLLVLAALLPPLWQRDAAPARADEAAGSNLRILREQLAELDAERAAGTLNPEQHARARVELERR